MVGTGRTGGRGASGVSSLAKCEGLPGEAPPVIQYQSFRSARGHSDSKAKLKSLRLPRRLDSMAVLDIGCNEGFFCQEAWRRGAARIVGVDKDAQFIARARERDARTDYRQIDWSELDRLGETFDLVLLLSSLHYARDPNRLLLDAFELLKPDGSLIVEAGVAPGRRPAWVPSSVLAATWFAIRRDRC